MSCRHVYQVECGDKRVTEGIGDHYKIEITEELKNDCLSWKKIIKGRYQKIGGNLRNQCLYPHQLDKERIIL